jgi:DNA-binding NarL/FixJ family response regulator
MQESLQGTSHPRTFLDVFIVEGSQPVRERLEELVASIAGARCSGSAASADEAMGAIRRLRPDAVILDIGLADGRGFELLRALGAWGCDMSIYVLSNFTMEPYKRLAYRLGAAAFFDKSTQFDAMRALLAQRAANPKRQHPQGRNPCNKPPSSSSLQGTPGPTTSNRSQPAAKG